MKPASEFHEIHGLRYHVQRWGQIDKKKMFLLHGFGDCGLSFQFLAEQMLDLADGNLDIVAPDWRGFGRSEYAAGGYWFPDYYADLDALLNLYSADDAVTLVGHSMGGNIACMYAGIRPHRVAQLVAVDGLGLPSIDPDEAPGRFATWLNELQQEPSSSRYSSIDALAERYQAAGKKLHLVHLSSDCKELLHKAGNMVEVNMLEDPHYHMAMDELA